jgi:glycosyltransferase involved in cell wall biosynthesis
MNELTPRPLVSVVLTTYNGEVFLEEQLDSLFQQTYSPIEVIAVDDGSTDNTLSILNRYAAAHSNMKVFVNEDNLGFIKNFEKGCKLSRGQLISLCDQDDHWDKDKIKKMAAEIGEYPLIYCDSRLCDEKLQDLGRNISDIVHNQDFDNCLQLAVMCRMYGHALLFTRSLFDKAYPFLEVIPHDWWLAFTATLNGGVKYLPEPLVLYRQHAANVFGVIGGKRKKNGLEKKAFLENQEEPGSAEYGERQEKEEDEKKVKHSAKAEHSGAAGIRNRIRIFYETCPERLVKEKKVLSKLVRSYRSFSLPNNFRRTGIFFSNCDQLLTVKKYSLFRKYFFCLKTFIKIK